MSEISRAPECHAALGTSTPVTESGIRSSVRVRNAMQGIMREPTPAEIDYERMWQTNPAYWSENWGE